VQCEDDPAVAVTGVSIDKSSITIGIGDTEKLIAIISPADATNKNLVWESSYPDVATVLESGVVNAKSLGMAEITVNTEDGNFSCTCKCRVNAQTLAVDNISFNMIYVPGKSFFTGTDDSGTATVEYDYWIGETEVTYELWQAVYTWATATQRCGNFYTFANEGTMISGDSNNFNEYHPVTTLNWRDAMVWCNAATEWYNAHNGTNFNCVYYTDACFKKPIRTATATETITVDVAGSQDSPYVKPCANGFRLLSSLEWELAGRYINDANNDGDIQDPGEYYAGNYANGVEVNSAHPSWLMDYVWFWANSGCKSHEVKQKLPNALGIHDMSGNVEEWCFSLYSIGDWFSSDRIARGGSWNGYEPRLRVGDDTDRYRPYRASFARGFRLAKTQ
jgi:sulfatase modifying factor 1